MKKEKIIKVYENEELFQEIMKRCRINEDISTWDYSSDNTINYPNAKPLVGKYAGHHFGWLVYREWGNSSETYITYTIEEEKEDK